MFQLTGETINDPSTGTSATSYAYDAAGNRINETNLSGTTTYSYDANSRLLSAGATTFTYDNNGNTLSQTTPSATTTYQYDGLNRLVQVTTAAGVTTYAYDAAGNRVQTQSPSGTTNYLVDPFGIDALAQVLRETDGTGARLADYVYAGSDLLSFSTSTGTAFRLADGQRSTRQLADASGNVTDSYTYDAFGNLLGHTGSTPNNYLYAGQQFDPNLSAYYLRARYYTSTSGRFLTTDPLAGSPTNPRSLARYTYAANDPVNGWDPSGMTGELADSEIAAAGEAIVESNLDAVSVEESFEVVEIAEAQVNTLGTGLGITLSELVIPAETSLAELGLEAAIDQVVVEEYLLEMEIEIEFEQALDDFIAEEFNPYAELFSSLGW